MRLWQLQCFPLANVCTLNYFRDSFLFKAMNLATGRTAMPWWQNTSDLL
jgi:hypothetical protein